jgi:glycosyltransferase involved in cell wall biosynthesis
MTYSIVCLSPQEWEAPLPTNRQQIMRRAAAHGHDVLFVETGHFLGRHLWRLARTRRLSLARRVFGAERVDEHVTVVKALNVLPWGHRSRIACAIDNRVTALRLRRAVARLPQPAVAWVYDPCAGSVASALPVALTLYDCVDDYAEQTRGDERRSALVRACERAVVAHAGVVAATSSTQADRLHAVLVPNVAEHAHFAAARDASIAAPDVRGLAHPVIGFAGNLLPGKVDFELLAGLAAARPAWTFLCVGPIPDERAVEPLRRCANVVLTGPRPYAELPRYVAAFDVGLIPYRANDYTRSCFPLKTYEYLAAGKPVVATGLPELAGMEPDVVLAAEPLAALDAALAANGPEAAARRSALAAGHTWETRAATLLDLVDRALA